MFLPKGRSHVYADWRACERFSILPPGISATWEENNWWSRLLLVAYDQIRQMEDAEWQSSLLASRLTS